MTQEIKAGDYVYIPSESLKPIKCFYDEDNECLRINFDDINAHVWFNENGCLIGKLDKTNIPLLWLATPENKAKIEQFYGIELEDVPVDDDVELFKVMLDISLSETEKGNFNKEKHFDTLVQMFKERGKKMNNHELLLICSQLADAKHLLRHANLYTKGSADEKDIEQGLKLIEQSHQELLKLAKNNQQNP